MYPTFKVGTPNRWTIPDKDYSDFGDATQEGKEPNSGLLPFNVFERKGMTGSHGGMTSGVSGEQEQTTHDGPGNENCTSLAIRVAKLREQWQQAELDWLLCAQTKTKCSYSAVASAYAAYLELYQVLIEQCPSA